MLKLKTITKVLKPLFLFAFLITFSLVASHYSSVISRAEPNCDNPAQGDLNYCIDKIQREIDALAPAHETNKKELTNLRSKISSLSKQISVISNNLDDLADQISINELDLAYAKEVFNEKTSSYYKFLRFYDPITPFIVSKDASKAFKEILFQQRASEEDRQFMDELAGKLFKLKDDKELLEKSRTDLTVAKKSLDSGADFLGAEVEKVESYIASLSAKQQQFIAQKLGSLNLPTTLGAGPLLCVNDRDLKYDPGFRPAFAFFTYGIPHRVGMNQYGAYGRASSQNAEEILRTYFQNFDFSGGYEGRTVIVNGTNEFGQSFNNETMNIEDYLKHLYEMPTSWHPNALQAQAIAARSYALYEMDAKGYLKPSQADQVIKRELNDGNWQAAVAATRGKVMTQGGSPIKAWYASTSGGYTFTSGDVWGGERSWTKRLRDTTGGVSNFSDLQSTAYDKASPCFYASQGWRKSYSNSAWLKAEEVADIVNAILLARADASTKDNLYQPDKPHPYGGEVWDENRVKQELLSRGITPLNNASSVSISGVDWGIGKTTQVTINGVSFSGEEFKDFFNLRAPANIQIVGPLYNVERK